MTFLLVCKQKKNLDTFDTFVAALLALGHRVVLTLQERDAARDARIVAQFASPLLAVVPCPDGRADQWRGAAPLIRTARDWAQYARPPYASAAKLSARAAARLARELAVPADSVGQVPVLPPVPAARVTEALRLVEGSIPSDPLHDEFLRAHKPDVVLVTPGLHFGSGQADFIKSARALGLPAWMLLFSWDNLSTKGALHVAPDLMFVWNERQRREAVELHDFPADRVVVVGAPRFDPFFALRSQVDRRAFHAPLGLDPARKTVLYLCSSRFIAEDEPAFIRAWLDALRGARGPVHDCNVIVRPHPDVPLDGASEPITVTWPKLPLVTGWVLRPFDDPHTVVLRTTYRTQEALYECLHHADAVVALNTSAELEAGIAGRPVFTVLATDRSADGQAHTLHFNYLLREHGGFVTFADTLAEHVHQLDEELGAPAGAHGIQQFVRDFLRPHGDTPVAPLLARLVVAHAERAPSAGDRHSPPAFEGTVPRPVRPAAPLSLDDAAGPRVVEPAAAAPGAAVDTRLLRLTVDSPATILATADTRRWRRDGLVVLSPAVRAWIEEELRPGDTLYDVGASVGAYALLAAVHRGCTVAAFEPAFASFKALCDNIVRNGCGRSVLPLPIALGARAGLLELEYAHEAGADQYAVSERAWRSARDGVDTQYVQPVCAEVLDDVVSRHGLPPPHALRLAVRRRPEQVLQGAQALLRLPGLRTVLVTLRSAGQADAVASMLTAHGFLAPPLVDEGDHGFHAVFSRASHPGSTAGGLLRRLGAKLSNTSP